MQIQISWLLDLDLHCLQRQGICGFSSRRVDLFDILITSDAWSLSFLFFSSRRQLNLSRHALMGPLHRPHSGTSRYKHVNTTIQMYSSMSYYFCYINIALNKALFKWKVLTFFLYLHRNIYLGHSLKVADWANFDMTKITEAPLWFLSFPDCCFDIYNVCKIRLNKCSDTLSFTKII